MSIRNLEHLFRPASIAVIGASDVPRSVGATVLQNLVAGKFAGLVLPVNPRHSELAGRKSYPNVAALPVTPELAVICTPPATVPALIEELGARGTKAAVVITAGLGLIRDNAGRTLKQAMLAAAKPHLMRILGPNCVGLLVPGLGINASFAHTDALPGRIAFVSQSGALVTAVLDWAKSRGIGFSNFISLGDSADVDAGDVLDYLASDPQTQSILLYLESVTSARKFMSAARAASRNKPVLVVKAGRAPDGAKAAASHTGALAGADDVYDAAIRRAGMLRMFTTYDLFEAVETLARARPLYGDRLTIMTNGGGPGVMAADALTGAQGRLSGLGLETLLRLDAVLPATWSRGNPIDIIGDAPAERYVKTLETVLADKDTDAVLLIHAPTAMVPSSEVADAVRPLIERANRNVLTCWVGGDTVKNAKESFDAAGIPTYDTPEAAVHAFEQIVQYKRNQELLMEAPASLASGIASDSAVVRRIVKEALAEGRSMLGEAEAKNVLAAYGIPVVETRVAADGDDAVKIAEVMGFPVALKILSPDIAHKSDAGGVALGLEDGPAVAAAAAAMTRRIATQLPRARLHGFTVQPMVKKPSAHELIAGIGTDPVFGPVILFGQGGTAVEVTADHAIGLPPLNSVLARDMISRTRVSRLLAGYRDRPPADLEAISRTLIQLAQMAADIPEIAELDINPLLAYQDGVLALDARIHVTAASAGGADRFAIRPYPAELEEAIEWGLRRILLRPIKPEDSARHQAFFNALDPDDIRFRMFTSMREISASQLARLSQIDYDREMAFIAIAEREDGDTETLGVARAIADPDNTAAEFAIIVRSDLKGGGLGSALLNKLIDYCRSRGTGALFGIALKDNPRMIGLARRCGFSVTYPAGDTVDLRLELTQPSMRGEAGRTRPKTEPLTA